MGTLIKLSCFDMTVTLRDRDPERPSAYLDGTIASSLRETGDDATYLAAVDVVESLVLAHAKAGVDVTTPAYEYGIDTAIQAIFRKFAA